MKNSIIITLTLAFILSFSTLQGQDNLDGIRHTIGVELGYAFANVQESRFSKLTKQIRSPKFGMNYSKENTTTKQVLAVHYTGLGAAQSSKGLLYNLIRPEVNYAYLRKYKMNWVGGFFNSTTLLNMPKSSLVGFGNNPISYTIAQSLGIRLERDHDISIKGKDVQVSGSSQFSLLSHLIRPAYGHPYPEDFLNEDAFSPTQAGLASSLIKSGKIVSVNKYMSFQISLSISYQFKDHVSAKLIYNSYVEKVRSVQPAQFWGQDVLVGVYYRN